MPRCSFALVASLALVLLAAPAARADFGFGAVQGTWEVTVTPQPVSGRPTPLPFRALFGFHFGGTLSETDGGIHPGSRVAFFPELGLLSAGDGLGAWTRKGHRRAALTFFKVLFAEQEQIGYLRVRGEVTLSPDRKRFSGDALSDFILGPGLESGDLFFSGPVRLDGRRLGVVPTTP